MNLVQARDTLKSIEGFEKLAEDDSESREDDSELREDDSESSSRDSGVSLA